MDKQYDALVIGGGPGGSAAAILLARAGWSVALLERKEFPRRKVCGEYASATNRPLFRHLGVLEAFDRLAGPAVQRVALFAGATACSAPLPPTNGSQVIWGRALAREHLDALLLGQAARVGVDVRQPWSVIDFVQEGDAYLCSTRPSSAVGIGSDGIRVVRARIVVAAHGSWEPGRLPTQPRRPPPRPSDLLAFKAHFRGSELAEDLMPLLAFPGGYGGMVHCDGGRVSLSCCIRRDQLARLRRRRDAPAGSIALEHILESCRGVRQALEPAALDGAWLSAGPIRPGIRLAAPPGLFPVGNAAGEAHPVVAEGISMALQSAWLLTERLVLWRRQGGSISALDRVAQSYAAAWRRSFGMRLRVSQAAAHWAMRPGAVVGTLPAIRSFPTLLSWAARWSGKARCVVH
jgi:flavin-dependent dehydrogenase